MSWINELYYVYEKNKEFAGEEIENCTLLPVYHTTNNAQLQVNVFLDGTFLNANEVAKEDDVTIIPVTEDSGSRTNGINPHPLCDKLIYVAGDYDDYVNDSKKYYEYFEKYILSLEKWASSEFSHPSVKAVYAYLKNGTLIKDLCESGVLMLDKSGKLDEKYKVGPVSQKDFFVRFAVYDCEANSTHEPCVWKDKTLYKKFVDYYSSQLSGKDLCYATGQLVPCTYKHMAKIRNAGDKAKLVSTNDDQGFTYRGRFLTKEESYALGSEFSQEAHLALRWLIQRQGRTFGDFTVVSWESSLNKLPDACASSINLGEDEFGYGFEENYCKTEKEFSEALNKAIAGYYQKLDFDSKVITMGLDSATPGRLSVTMCNELSGTEFLDNIKNWYSTCNWHIRYKNKKDEIVNTIGTPSLYRIVTVIYGVENGGMFNIKSNLKSYIIKQMLPCIISAKQIPEHILKTAFNKAAAPQMYSNRYLWEEVLDITCALYRKDYKKRGEDYYMELDLNNTDRSYLYGRLLAVADRVEYLTYDPESQNKRMTNAKRYMQAFIANPYKTWLGIYSNIQPYFLKLNPGQRIYYDNIFSEINGKFNEKDYELKKALEAKFFMGFYAQMAFMKNNKNEKQTEEKE